MHFLRIVLFFVCASSWGEPLIDDAKIIKDIDRQLEANLKKFPAKESLYKPLIEKIDFEKGENPESFEGLIAHSLILVRAYKCRLCPQWHKSLASAFAVRKDGVLLTNYHVVDPKKRGDKFLLMDKSGKCYPITEISLLSKKDDVALLRCNAKDLPVIGLSTENEVGAAVRLISHPDGRFYSFSQGYVTRHFYRISHGEKAQQMSILAPFAKGSSGAPVVNAEGAVVGMVSYTRSIHHSQENGEPKNLQMIERVCIPTQVILDLLKNE